ncbi:MAG: hypothetical protein WCK70_03560 [Chloroflexales bacterium]
MYLSGACVTENHSKPLLHKPSTIPSDQPAHEGAPSEAADLFARLMVLANSSGGQDIPQPVRSARRRSVTGYDRFVTLTATGIGLLVCAAAWFVGAYFTLDSFASFGVGWAADALAALRSVFPGTNNPAVSSVNAGAWFIWAIPLGITIAEIGFDPGRARGQASRVLWGVFLIMDATTTALGISLSLVKSLGGGLAAAGLAAGIGLLLALVPEKLARRLIRENF